VTTCDISIPEIDQSIRTKRLATIRLLIVACVLTALAGRFVFLVKPFNPDSAMFVYLGKSVCDGDRFGHDVIDNKFPTVGLMTSLSWRAFGTNWSAYIVMQTMMSFGAALLLARSAARVAGENARLPVALAGIVYINFSLAVFGGFQLETLQLFFGVIAACSAMETLRCPSVLDALVVGLAAGVAAMIKPTGLAPLAAWVLVLLLQPRRRLQHLAAALIGLSMPVAVTIIYLVRFDILREMPELYRQISAYASNTPLDWEDVLKPITILSLAGFAPLIRGWVYRRGEHRCGDEAAPPRPIVLFSGLWFAIELAGAMLQRRMYAYHFLPVAPPAALLFGLIPRRNLAMPLIASLGPMMLFSLLGSLEVLKYPDPRVPIMPTSAYLLRHASPGDAVWEDALPRLLLETNLRPGARYPLMFLMGNYDTAALDYIPTLLDDFERRRPKFVILPTNVDEKIRSETTFCAHLARSPERSKNFAWAWHEVEKYVKAHYVAEVQIRGETVYRRRD
jgi:hypothetical protein